jgi:hypothetical protein
MQFIGVSNFFVVKMPFLKNKEQEGKTGPVWNLLVPGKGEDVRREYRRVNVCKYYLFMYQNVTIRHIELFQEWGEEDKGE